MALSQRLPQPKKKKETLGLKVETPTGCTRAPAKKRMRSRPSDAAPGPGGSAPRDGEQRLGHQQRAQWRRGEDPRVVWCLQVGGWTSLSLGLKRGNAFLFPKVLHPRGDFLFLSMSSCYTGRKFCSLGCWEDFSCPAVTKQQIKRIDPEVRQSKRSRNRYSIKPVDWRKRTIIPAWWPAGWEAGSVFV